MGGSLTPSRSTSREVYGCSSTWRTGPGFAVASSDGHSKRAVCREFEIHWDTLEKILHHSEPPPAPSPSSNPSSRSSTSYDNSRIAVAKILGSRDRKVTGAFLKLKSHHLSDSHFCLVRRPHEKGHVETLIGFARRRFLVPVPIGNGGSAPLNADLQRRCREDLTRRTWDKSAAKIDRPDEERSSFPAMPSEAFVAARVEPRRVGSLSLVSFDANQSSVPTGFAPHPVTVVASVDEVRVVAGDRVAAVHRRCRGREQVTYHPVHFERKPGALDFAAPLQGWELPVCFGVLRR